MKQKTEDIINQLLKIAVKKSFSDFASISEGSEPHHSFHNPEDNYILTFQGYENTLHYESSIKKLYSVDLNIYKNFSHKEFEKEFIKDFKTLFDSTDSADASFFLNFLNRLNKKPTIHAAVIKDIYGIKLNNHREPFKLGLFTIFHYPTHCDIINSKTNISSSSIWRSEQKHEYLIGVEVSAKGKKKIIEIAYSLFSKFEKFISLLIGVYISDQRVSIIEPIGWYYDKSILITKDEVYSPSSLSGAYVPIDLDNPFYSDPDNGVNSLWNLLQFKKLTSVQSRLSSAIDWFGKACCEKNIENRFLFFMIAIESILTFQEKGVLVSPSIASVISDGIVFLLSDSSEDRKLLAKRINKLYQTRSSIAHGAKHHVTEEDERDACKISRSLIMRFLTDTDLFNLPSQDALNDLIKTKRYN